MQANRSMHAGEQIDACGEWYEGEQIGACSKIGRLLI